MWVFRAEYLAWSIPGERKVPGFTNGLLKGWAAVGVMKLGEYIADGERMYEDQTGISPIAPGGRSQYSPGSWKQSQPEAPLETASTTTVSLGA